MLLAGPGEPLWIRSDVSLYTEPLKVGISPAIITKKPLRAIYIRRAFIHGNDYVVAYVDGYGERLIHLSDVRDMQ